MCSLSGKNMIWQWLLIQLFADLPPDIWGGCCPHIGILGIGVRELKRKVVWNLCKYVTGINNFWVNCNHRPIRDLTPVTNGIWACVCACFSMCVPQWCWGQQCPGTAVRTKERPGAQLTDDSGQRLISHTAIHEREKWLKETDPNTNSHTSQHTYHNGTADSSCWWCSDPQPEFLHVSKLEWAQCMTHKLFRPKNKQITKW